MRQRARNKQECLNTAVTVFGWSFDIAIILINLADVVSDCLVAAEFYRAGHTTFFWLVIASLLLANVIYTIFGVELMLRDKMSWRGGCRGWRVWQYPGFTGDIDRNDLTATDNI